MASIFKSFSDDDMAKTEEIVHESVPITGTIVSGTYSDNNIKNYGHGMFQSVYDYPILSSSANHIFDTTFAYSPRSPLSSSTNTQNAKKINLYNSMAQQLAGYDITGSILEFDEDGDILAGGTKIREAVFVNFSRLLYKDEIKKGTFQLQLGGNNIYTSSFGNGLMITINDTGSATNFRTNSPAGEYGILFRTTGQNAGLVYYQAGIAVLTSSLFKDYPNMQFVSQSDGAKTFDEALTGSEISSSCDAFRHRWYNSQFSNTVEINSSIYFCRINHSDFFYSSNPTYVSASKIRVKNVTADTPISYISTVGLYSADGEMIAVGKLSEILKNTPSTELIIRARLDF